MRNIILSIDPSDEGEDLSVLCFCRVEGGCLQVFRWEASSTLNEVKAAHLAASYASELQIPSHNIVVDSVGVGAGCLNTLIQQGYCPYRFLGSASAESVLPFYQFKNKRAEAAWLLRESFKAHKIRLLNPPERLKNELLATSYFIENEKMIALPPKRDIKRKLGHSPDYFDALCMANYLYCQNATRSITAMTARPERTSPLLKGF